MLSEIGKRIAFGSATRSGGRSRLAVSLEALKRLWREDAGFLATTDVIFLAAIVVIGTIVGLTSFRDQVVQEFGDLATAVGRLNQSYSYEGCNEEDEEADHWVAGSDYTDEPDFGETPDLPGEPPAGISVTESPSPEGPG